MDKEQYKGLSIEVIAFEDIDVIVTSDELEPKQ
jgi:hypothetical protein